jgi:ketose-bisphosphate aldolase
MLLGLRDILAIGESRRFAVPAFNVYNFETMLGVAEAAEEANAPLIFQIYSRLFDGPSGMPLVRAAVNAAADLKVPAAVHLDHGAGVPQVMRALRGGASSVMIDASILPLEENIAAVKQVVELCRAAGVCVEGELGHIGSTAEAPAEYTRVDEAKRFAEETGVAALAIMVGTAHGRYKQAPVIDVRRIRDIGAVTGLPLVLHGGSGVPDDQIRASIEAGIRKINFGTDLCYAFLDTVFEVPRNIVGIDLFMKEPIAVVKRFALEKIKLLGACGNG